jgi:competence protein ComEC
MEEKLNSIIATTVFIVGLIIPMDITSNFYLILFLTFICFLTCKCRLLLICSKKIRYTIIFLLLIFLLGLCRGYIFSENYSRGVDFSEEYDGKAQISVFLKDEKYIIKLTQKPFCKVLLSTKQKLKPGMIIGIKGNLIIPQDESNRGGFSYKDYLMFKGIKFILNSDDITIHKQIKNIRFYLFEYQEYFTEKLRMKIGAKSRFIESIFLGEINSLDEKEVDTWRKMGILHLQAVSGSQVGAVLDILLFLFVITPKKGFLKYIILFIPLALYGLITDTPSVWRVIIFLIIIKIFQILRKEKYEMLALMLSSVLLMIINPGVVFSISFQLSYIISIGLLLNNEKIMEVGKPILKLLFSGILSVILSWPILVYYFQEVSLMSLFFTPIISPVIQLIIFITGILMLFPFLMEIAVPLSIFLKLILILLEKITILFKDINLPVYIGMPWGLTSIILFYVLYVFWNNQIFMRKYRKLLVCVFLIIFSYKGCIDIIDNRQVVVSFINVGQGDCILIECKEVDKVILIDGGAKNDYLDMGEREVLPYLKRKGIKNIDIIISTHSDNDHRGGLETILRKIPVSHIWIPKNRDSDYKDWLIDYKSEIDFIHDNMIIKLGDMSIEIINPIHNIKDEDTNASSVVLSLEYGESNILLTGDCDLAVLESLAKKSLYYDIIKAPHHGSINSYRSGIYSDLKAKGVIFSVGKNKYGHPSKNIIKELEKDNILYYRTDRDLDLVVTLKKLRIDINGRKLID